MALLERQRVALWLVAAALFAALLFVAYRFPGTIVFGLFIYYVTRPVYERLRTYVPSRTLAVTVALVVLVLPALLLFGWTLTLALQELIRFSQSAAFEQVLASFQPYLDVSVTPNQLRRFAQSAMQGSVDLSQFNLRTVLSGTLSTLVESVTALGAIGLNLFMVVIIAFYLLRDDYRIADWARSLFVTDRGVLETYFLAVDRDLEIVYFGNILNAFLTGTIGAITYSLLNLVAPSAVSIPAPTLVGLLSGVASLVPVVGIKLVYVPVFLYLLGVIGIEGGSVFASTVWFPLLFALVSVVVVDVIPDMVLRPYVSGRTLHVGAVMLAYIFGPLLFGWYGIFLGPLVLVAVVEFARIVLPWLVDPEATVAERTLFEEEEPTPAAASPAPAGAGVEDDADATPESRDPGTDEAEASASVGPGDDRRDESPDSS